MLSGIIHMTRTFVFRKCLHTNRNWIWKVHGSRMIWWQIRSEVAMSINLWERKGELTNNSPDLKNTLNIVSFELRVSILCLDRNQYYVTEWISYKYPFNWNPLIWKFILWKDSSNIHSKIFSSLVFWGKRFYCHIHGYSCKCQPAILSNAFAHSKYRVMDWPWSR